MRPQVGVAVNAILFENLNISGTGGGRTMRVGTYLKKYYGRVLGFLETPTKSKRGGAIQFYFISQYIKHGSN